MIRHKWKLTDESGTDSGGYGTRYFTCERCKSQGFLKNEIIYIDKSSNWDKDCDEVLNLAIVKSIMNL